MHDAAYASQPEAVVALRNTILLQSAELDPDFRWRLADNLFSQYRAMIDGSLALALVEGICRLQTGSAVYLLLMAAVLVVAAARAALTVAFYRRAGAGNTSARTVRPGRRGTADGWALHFVIGNACTAGLFGATALYTCLAFADPTLQMLVLLVEGAWLAGSTQRNAASPAAVVAQTALVSIPTIIGAAASGNGLVQWVILFVVAHALSARSGMKYFGDLYLNTLLTEQRLAKANARLTQLSATDSLTGIGNRRAFDSALHTALRGAARGEHDVSLIMIDVDHFKRYNDQYGHPAGDDCLRRIALLIDGIVRGRSAEGKATLVARVGGEEFAALLPGVPLEGAIDVAEQIRDALLEAAMPHAGSPFGQVTISMGLGALSLAARADARTLLAMADEALYRAKQSGRDRLCGPDQGVLLWRKEPRNL